MSMSELNNIASILEKCFDAEFDNVSNINPALLFVWNYKPWAGGNPISLAFPVNEPKCWTSVKRTNPKKINNESPNYHPDYKCFNHKGTQFFPYSIQAISIEKMNDVELFNQVCLQMHEHMFGV